MPKRLFWSAWAGIVFCVLSACIFTLHFLQYRFGGYDLSPLIDSGWRVLQGQAPNRDFICTFPPILYVGVALAFRILGVRWLALSVASALYTSGLILLGMRILLLLRKRLGDASVLRLSLVFAVLQLLPYLAIGHPWHSSWTEAADLYAFAATFALLEIDSLARGHRVELLAHLCLAESLILLAKPNTGLPALAFCTLALLIRKNTRATALIAVGAALGLTSILLLGVHTSLLRQGQVYSRLSSRFVPKGYLEGLIWNRDPYLGMLRLTSYLVLFPVLVWVLWVTARHLSRGKASGLHVLALGGCVVTLVGLGTNTEFSPMDAPSLLFVAALLASVTSSPRHGSEAHTSTRSTPCS